MSNVAEPAYIPGVCNINRAEIKHRRNAGYFGLGLFIVVAAILLVLSINRWFRLVLFVPGFIAAIGFLQARNKFCVGYGAAGQQNASEGSAAATAITDQAAVKKDKSKARRMNLQAAAIGLVAAAIVLVLPVTS